MTTVAAALIETALRRGEGQLAADGAFVARTGSRTGRSPRDKFIVRNQVAEKFVDWGKVNQPMSPERFAHLEKRVRDYLGNVETFTVNAFASADPIHRLRIRVTTELAWHALFAYNMFLRPTAEELARFVPDYTILSAPGLKLDPTTDGTNSEVVVALDFERGIVLIAGTAYAGEIKKSVFSILNFLLPMRGIFPMHCSANVGAAGDVAIFFGLSGTGKTTLSADEGRRLIGDDEHGWANSGVFNLEGGCYAKTIRISPEREPQIFAAIRFGSVLENVPLDPVTRIPDFNSDAITENTRVAYPVDFIPNCELSGRGGHPKVIFFLTCDAFGVLPPLSKLSTAQAMYHFLSGYTAKVAGTEAGVTEPSATFSTCFGAPFLPLPPMRYAELLKDRLEKYRVPVWLVNTGWTGGPAGVGHRVDIPYTRAMLRAALAGQLDDVPLQRDERLGLMVPQSCPGVPTEILHPRDLWPNQADYDAQANKLIGMFADNFQRFAGSVPSNVREAGPHG